MPTTPIFIFQKNTERYRVIAMLERIISHRVRRWLIDIFLFLSLLFVVLTWAYVSQYPHILGMLFLSLAILLKLIAIEAMYYSYRFEDEDESRVREPYLFELSLMLSRIGSRDVVGDFINTREGRLILLRAGFRQGFLNKYREEHVIHIPLRSMDFPQSHTLFESFLKGIYHADATFEHMLLAQDISEDDLVEAAFFALYTDRLKENKRRWWHVEAGDIRIRDRMIQSLLALEHESDMHVSHPVFVGIQEIIPEDEFSHEQVAELFYILARIAQDNDRSVIVKEDMVQE